MLGRSLLKFKHTRCRDHPDQTYSLVCLEPECNNRGVICAECHLLHHHAHIAKPLALALKEIADDLQPLPQLLPLIAKLDQLYASFYQLLPRLPQPRRPIEEALLRFFRDLHDRIRNYRSACSRLLESSTLSEEFHSLLRRYRFFEREEADGEKPNLVFFLEEMVEQVKARSNEFEDSVKRRAESRELLELLTPLESEGKLTYRFSEEAKHTSISLSGDGLTATQSNNYSTNFALIEPAVEGRKNLRGKRSIRFYINKLSSWLSVGVAYVGIARKANFYFNTGSLGHGGFLLSYNGYSWHNSDSALNSNYVSFNYTQGDTLTLTINPAACTLTYEKQGSPPYTLPYERVPGDELHFCVSLSSHEESVTIVK